MSVTINTPGADTYFGPRNHVKAEIWKGFTSDQKTAAIAHAIRRVSRELGKEVEAETVDASTYYHPDRAVYEQALFMLQNSFAIPNGEETGPRFTATEPNPGDQPRKVDPDELCAEAAALLIRPRRQLFLIRG